jgi:hypothetical protein
MGDCLIGLENFRLAHYLNDLLQYIRKRMSFDESANALLDQIEIKCYRQIVDKQHEKIDVEEKLPIKIIEPGNVVWLQGGTGSGKTFVVHQIVDRALEHLKDESYCGKKSQLVIPVYIRAQDIGEYIDGKYLPENLMPIIGKYSQISTVGDLKKWLENLKVVFVIDEFEKNRDVVFVNALYEKYVKNNIEYSLLILSRVMDEYSCAFVSKPKVWHLKDVNFTRAVKVIRELIPSSNQRANVRFKEMVQNGIMERIPRTPLALKVLGYVFGNEVKRTPNNAFEFFDMFFEIVLGRWENSRDTENLYDYTQVRSFLEQAAYFMICKKSTSVELSELEPIALKILSGIGEKRVSPREFILSAAISGDIAFIENDRFEFSSRTYLEFLAGCEFKDHHWDLDFIIENLTDLDWEDCIIFAAGSKKREEKLLERLHEVGDLNLKQQFLKFKNVALILQALYQSESKSKVIALKAGLDAIIKVRDNQEFEKGIRVFINKSASDVLISLIVMKLFSEFYSRKSLTPLFVKLLNAKQMSRQSYYLLAALCNIELEKDEIGKVKEIFESAKHSFENREALALTSYVQMERDIETEEVIHDHKNDDDPRKLKIDESKLRRIDALFKSKRFKQLMQSTIDYLTEKKKLPSPKH